MSTIMKMTNGDSLPSIKLEPVTREDLIAYANASGDHNPIHQDDQEALNAGLPGIIAHGMWTMGNLTKLFTPYVEEGFMEEIQIRFRGMVFLGDVVTLEARADEVSDETVRFSVRACQQDDRPVVEGEVFIRLYGE
ncbi:MaoC/PaaZ C-terminal domain-containing protein [Bacillus sp. Marseille-P3800]|uniref:MaoC/PaaZ C-terminal domain-containing protein n=1 Tax=Bacillus sp. Marseille-P3800 TaxID=2014782 RepID=UPI000C087E05|nr:MaoC/PaaZ C-terminal domain-containing protein [Bacillus sp. Marseille-P3800]